MKSLMIISALLISASAFGAGQKIYFTPHHAAKSAAKRAGMYHAHINVGPAMEGGWEACSGIYGGGCDSVRVKYYNVTAQSGMRHRLSMKVKCGHARYTGPAAKAFPNGRQLCTVVR